MFQNTASTRAEHFLGTNYLISMSIDVCSIENGFRSFSTSALSYVTIQMNMISLQHKNYPLVFTVFFRMATIATLWQVRVFLITGLSCRN